MHFDSDNVVAASHRELTVPAHGGVAHGGLLRQRLDELVARQPAAVAGVLQYWLTVRSDESVYCVKS